MWTWLGPEVAEACDKELELGKVVSLLRNLLRLQALSCSFLLLGTFAFADDEITSKDIAKVERSVDLRETDRSRVDAVKAATESLIPQPFLLLAPDSKPAPRYDTTRRFSTVAISTMAPPVEEYTWDVETDERRLPSLRDSDFSMSSADAVDDDLALPAHRDLITPPTAPTDPRVAALGRLAHKLAFRQLRRFFRSELRDRYQEDPSHRFLDYQEERAEIGKLGRGYSDVNENFELQQVRQGVLQNDEERIEDDVTLVNWGPFRVDDRGQFRIDVNKLREQRQSTGKLTIAPEERERPLTDSLFRGRLYRLNTDLKLRPNAHSILRGDSYREMLGEIGAKIEVDFFTPIIERKFMSAELETSVDEDGDAGLFVTFTLYPHR